MSYTAIQGFRHIQSASSTTWTIIHGLDTITPAVDCWVDISGSITKILPLTVTATDNKTVTITFSTAYSGEAFIS